MLCIKLLPTSWLLNLPYNSTILFSTVIYPLKWIITCQGLCLERKLTDYPRDRDDILKPGFGLSKEHDIFE